MKRKRPILIIEDDPIYRDSVIQGLGKNKFAFIEASNVQEGLEAFKDHEDLQVIILDLALPGASGLDFLRLLKDEASGRKYRVIISTGHEELLTEEKPAELRVFSFQSKGTREYSIETLRLEVELAFEDIAKEILRQKADFHLAIQAAINSKASLKTVLDLICKKALELVSGYTCHVRLFDQKKGDYELITYRMRGEKEPVDDLLPKRVRPGEFYSGQVAAQKEPKIEPDVQNDQSFKEIKTFLLKDRAATKERKDFLDTVRSVYIIPIITGITDMENEVDAILNISSNALNFFSKERQKLVDEFADQAAVAVTKHWLDERRKEVHSDYRIISEMLEEVSKALEGANKLNDIFDIVYDKILACMNPEVVSIFLFNEATQRLENVAEYTHRGRAEDVAESYRPGESLTGLVYSTGETLNPPFPQEHPNFSDDSDKQIQKIPSRKLAHYLCAPMKVGNKIIGVIRAINKRSDYYDEVDTVNDDRALLKRGFSPDCVNILEIAASHLAVAIKNTELLNELSQNVKQLRTINEVGREITSEIQINDLLKKIVKKTAKVMQAEVCMLFLRDENAERVVLRECFGIPKIQGAAYNLGEGNTGRVAETGKSILDRRVDKSRRGKYDVRIETLLSEQHGRRARIESFIAVPILGKGEILGVLRVINKAIESSQFDEDDVALLEIFASQIGVAIVNAQLYNLTNKKLVVAQRNAALSRLVGGVAHEINNTSGLIPANVGLLREHLGDLDDYVSRRLNLIKDASQQAVDFAKELLGFSASRMREVKPMDINDLIRQSIEEIRSDLKRQKNYKNIVLIEQLSDEAIVCHVHEWPFKQIARNIIINAYQAMERKRQGRLIIKTHKDIQRNTAFIDFIDNGSGIKKEHREKVFHHTFTTKPRGNGLGLWLAKMNLDNMGGRITIKSRVNRGTTFSIELPVHASEQVA